MSKMNYRRGMRGAKRGKTPTRLIPEGFILMAKRMHRRAVRRAGKVVIAVAMAEEEYYTPDIKPRDCLRMVKESPRWTAYWMVY